MTLDLLVLLLPYLPSAEASALFESCLSGELLESKDNAVQKRAYKILAKLMEVGKVSVDAQSVLQKLDGFLDGLSPAAKKVRPPFVRAPEHQLTYTLPRIGSLF